MFDLQPPTSTVQPQVTIEVNSTIIEEGQSLTIECKGEGFPPPNSSDFKLFISDQQKPPHHLTVEPIPSGLGVRAIIPEVQFLHHSGKLICTVDINVTEFDPSLPVRDAMANFHGNAHSQLYIYSKYTIIAVIANVWPS